MYFPNAVYKFVWRNWDVVPTDRMSALLGVFPETVIRIAQSMGLDEKPDISPEIFLRNRYNIISRNWDLLPNEQLCRLLGITPFEFKERLEDDGFLGKLGPKPECAKIYYDDTLLVSETETGNIRERVSRTTQQASRREPRFAFIDHLCEPFGDWRPAVDPKAKLDHETVIDSYWCIRLIGEAGLAGMHAAKDLQQFLWTMMGAHVTYSRIGSNTPDTAAGECEIRLLLRPADDVPMPPQAKGSIGSKRGEFAKESFRLRVEGRNVTIEAEHDRGLLRGVYELEQRLLQRGAPYISAMDIYRKPRFTPRIIFSYFAVFGDMLMGEDGDPYPEGLLANLSRKGYNAVWLPVYMKNMVTSSVFTEFGAGSEIRLNNLNRLIDRADKYGIDVYLYVNEPRRMEDEFFERYPHLQGHGERQHSALCTSTQEVKQYLEESMYLLFTAAPGLKGVFAITASESLTNCYSRSDKHTVACKRCRQREPFEVVSEVLNLMNKGAKRAKSDAEVIGWTWSWDWHIEPNPQPELLGQLENSLMVMTDFEWGITTKVGDKEGIIEEYCLSRSGPSDLVKEHRRLTRERNIKLLAKIQISNTLECGLVPYIPVLPLISNKFNGMMETGIDGFMASWSFGCHPSLNMEIGDYYNWEERPDKNAVLQKIAEREFGAEGAEGALTAWRYFCEGFATYPFSIPFVYTSPIQFGPAYKFSFQPLERMNGAQLREEQYRHWPETPTTGTFRPGENYRHWTKPYGPDPVCDELARIIAQWSRGIQELEDVVQHAHHSVIERLDRDLNVARCVEITMKSTKNAIRYLQWREQLFKKPEKKEALLICSKIIDVLQHQIKLAEQFYVVVSADSRLGFESATHYWFRPLDILESMVGCQQIVDTELPAYMREHYPD